MKVPPNPDFGGRCLLYWLTKDGDYCDPKRFAALFEVEAPWLGEIVITLDRKNIARHALGSWRTRMGIRTMTTRRRFLIKSAAVSAAGALTATFDGCSTEADTQGFNMQTFESILSKPARHRQCFGSTQLLNGLVLGFMMNSIHAYEKTLREGPGALHAVAVLYGGNSVALAMNDDTWRRYLIPSGLLHGEKGLDLAANRNPFYNEGFFAYASVRRLTSEGAFFFVCDNVLRRMAASIAKTIHQTPENIHNDLVSGLVPGSMVVPAGVMAINAAQEKHFTYIQVTPVSANRIS